ncbi:Transport and Golgi organization protein-like protein [Hapsidospora chrysogenum ATCC 11550]|uniref:Transport and Golgi organization protein-like protein n=1 Tax=Hapsidospora chrysogenum (strain ATCC 11550 / CBS 779.69 / DSM 880 / IAM 14645 / JCM 23072 / IMI 49137) TaxID=857340 RepID=A0A086TAF7_HAPC1|nr:Transport and Golgi organization protein-like protein [Hapsidospora chrysogenum ATCC 11550]
MCIVFISTAHPKYSLILIDNRDEFVLRPTSRPHWWTHTTPSGRNVEVLSSRDLQRPERGTWLGVTRQGMIAVLTNYREVEATGPSPKGRRSRGGMVTAWLGEPPDEGVRESVERLVDEGEGVRGVGGFSMACAKLTGPEWEGFAVVSNRAGGLRDVPIVSPRKAEAWGFTNTAFAQSGEWPKIADGLGPFGEIVRTHGEKKGDDGDGDADEEELVARLLAHLDTDTLHGHMDKGLAENIRDLKNSIFVPGLGGEKQREEMARARARGRGTWPTDDELAASAVADAPAATAASAAGGNGDDQGFAEGMYGTQRQTVVLVDREGGVRFTERALWDANGHEIPRGEGDVTIRFKIEGWKA